MRVLLLTGALMLASTAHARPGLNHVYVVLDQATFDAVRGDPRIAALLGPSDGGLPDYAAPRADADRIFLRGRTTYLELFGPKNRFNEPVGKVGIAVAEDRPARFERLAQRWRAHCPGGFGRTPVAWTRSHPPIPWYDSIQCEDTATRADLSVWAMAYRPQFGQWQLRSPETRRHEILKPRAAAGQGRFDITGVELSVPAQLQKRLVAQFRAAGFAARTRVGVMQLRGNDWTLTLRTTESEVATLSAIELRTDIGMRQAFCVGTAQVRALGRSDMAVRFSSCSS